MARRTRSPASPATSTWPKRLTSRSWLWGRYRRTSSRSRDGELYTARLAASCRFPSQNANRVIAPVLKYRISRPTHVTDRECMSRSVHIAAYFVVARVPVAHEQNTSIPPVEGTLRHCPGYRGGKGSRSFR